MYQLTTGIPIQFDSIATLTQYATVRLRSISNPSVLNLTHEAWLVTASAMGDGLAVGAFADLSHLVSLDSRLQWTDMFTQTREAGLIYGRQVIALPLSTYSYQLHYRMDLLAKYNRTVPTTWRQLIETASQLNGTEGKWGFCGNWGPCALLGTNLVKLVMASMTQALGGSQGWLIDPDSLQNLVDSPAMMETLDIIKALHRLSSPFVSSAQDCSLPVPLFVTGECFMTISHGSTFKSAPELRFFSYSVLSYLASAGVLDALVLDPDSGRRWIAAGYQADDATRFLAAHRASLQHPNMHVQIRIPGASAFVSTAGNMVLKITAQQQDHERVMAEAAASLTASFTKLFGYNTSLFRT
ncbi:guanylate cyclase domain-containing protein, partial [Haematococcus lacustris]